MAHRQHLVLIKSATDGERLRKRIRQDREHDRRRGKELIAESKRLIEEANKIMADFTRITPRK